VTELVSNFKN